MEPVNGIVESSEPVVPAGPSGEDLAGTVAAVASAVAKSLSPGDRSALRRLMPESPNTAAFWKIVVDLLEPRAVLPAVGPARDAAERKWAVLVRGMALMPGYHSASSRMGAALARADFSELRLLRLLRARGRALETELTSAIRFLAARPAHLDWTEPARLLLAGREDRKESIRRQIARDYYRAQNQKS